MKDEEVGMDKGCQEEWEERTLGVGGEGQTKYHK